MLPSEYNHLYTKDPTKWSNIKHDEQIFNYISKYEEPKTLLEIGCGNGHMLECVSQHWSNTIYTGLDFSCVAVDICQEKLPAAEFICADVLEYKPTGKFEMILLVGVAEHFDNPQEKLEYICQKLLKNNGVMYIEVPNCRAYTHAPKEEGFHRILHGTKQMEWHYKRETWEQIIFDAGFEILESIVGLRKHNEFIWIVTR